MSGSHSGQLIAKGLFPKQGACDTAVSTCFVRYMLYTMVGFPAGMRNTPPTTTSVRYIMMVKKERKNPLVQRYTVGVNMFSVLYKAHLVVNKHSADNRTVIGQYYI